MPLLIKGSKEIKIPWMMVINLVQIYVAIIIIGVDIMHETVGGISDTARNSNTSSIWKFLND